MADVTETLTANPPESAAVLPAAQEKITIEQRTDVTVDELEKASFPYPAELYNGKVVYKMANLAHGKIEASFTTELTLYSRENPVGEFFTETNFRLWPDRPKESRMPDISFILQERLPEDWRRFPAMAPDLAIEIISPSDNFLKVMNKVDAYLEQGSKMVWLVIADKREVLVCLPGGKYTAVRDVLTAPELLPGFELPVEKIFAGLPEPTPITEE